MDWTEHGRLRLVVALLAAGALGTLSLATLAGAAYTRFVDRHLDRPQSAATLEAARIAAEWQPWSSTTLALQGWVRAENGEAGAALAAYGKALAVAPADALLWTEYAQVLARIGRFDAALTHALARATRLAPTSVSVRRGVAEMGLSYWTRGAPEQRAAWLVAMRHELARNRGPFLGHALTRGQGRTFCEGPARVLGEEAWCAAAATALLGGCFELSPVEPVPCSVTP